MPSPKTTALHDVHLRHGARMVPFGGWSMPLEYSGISREHEAVRTAVGLFDVSHMGEFIIDGPSAVDLLDYVTTNDVRGLAEGQAQYSAMACPQGTVVDDLLVYRLSGSRYMLVVNAGNIEKDFHWLQAHNRFGARVDDASERTTLLALQGPLAADTLRTLTSRDLSGLKYYRFAAGNVCGVEGVLSRTGYTGEDGFEFYFPRQESTRVWGAMLDAGRTHGILPAGLGARNTLRLEAAFLLYGNDIDETTTMLEAGLGWITRLDKPDFIGRESLVRQQSSGIARKLAGFRMLGREIARDGYSAWLDGAEIGRVSSGGPSITLNRNIGLAYLPAEHAAPGTRFQVQVRKRFGEAEVVPTPFYKRRRSV